MAKVMSPNAAQWEREGAQEAIVLLNQGGREHWSARQVQEFAEQQWRRRVGPGSSVKQHALAEGFRRTAYAISKTRDQPNPDVGGREC